MTEQTTPIDNGIAFIDDPATFARITVGVELAERAIGSTLGPAGGTGSIGRAYGRHRPTKDGVTVAKAVEHEDWLSQRGIDAVVNGCSRQAGVGDGTSSTAVMIAELWRGAVPKLAGGANGVRLAREIEKAADAVVEAIDRDASGDPRLFDVAMTSTNGDEELSRMIADAVEYVGENGLITRRGGIGIDPRVEYAEGSTFRVTPADPAMLMGGNVQLDKAAVFVFNGDLHAVSQPLQVAIKPLAESRTPIVLVAHSFAQRVKSDLVKILSGGTKIFAVEPQGDREDADEVLLDIAAAAGAKLLPAVKVQTMEPNWIAGAAGSLGQVQLGRVELIALEVGGDVSDRVAEAHKKASDARGPQQKKAHEHRAAMLDAKAAHVYIDATTEGQLGAKMDAAEDAILACRAALTSGTVCGGGITLLRARSACPDTVGGFILRRALARPFLTLVANGNPNGEPAEYITPAMSFGGFDPVRLDCVNLEVAGVVDPTSVITGSVRAAASAVAELVQAKAFVKAKDPKRG